MPILSRLHTEQVGRIKADIETLLGREMRVRVNLGRRKVIECNGILEEIYPNLFIVSVRKNIGEVRRISYSYADVLTKTVELSNPQSGENFFAWLHSKLQ